MDEKKQRCTKEILIGIGLILLAVILLIGWKLQEERKEVYEITVLQTEKDRENQMVQKQKTAFQVTDENGVLQEVTGTDLDFAKKMIEEYVTREGIHAEQAVCKGKTRLSEALTNVNLELDDPDATILTMQYDAEKGAVTVLEMQEE